MIRGFFIHRPVYSSIHKYVCVSVMIFVCGTRTHLSVFVHHGLLLNLCFDDFLAYRCITTILNTFLVVVYLVSFTAHSVGEAALLHTNIG